MKPSQVVLVIMDGWGLGPPEHNAIRAAATPNFAQLAATFPHSSLATSGAAVGLPIGQMGNSEVGHLSIGAGRVVHQELTRINREIETGSFFSNAALGEAMAKVPIDGALHLLGLLSDGGVHSQLDHIEALLRLAKERGVKRVYLHPLLDGRDVPPQSAPQYIRWLEQTIEAVGVGSIASIGGRYYAMDRDQRWPRVEAAYRVLIEGQGPRAASAAAAVAESYAAGVNDEFVVPTLIDPKGTIKSGDSVIAFNFRPDRMRQITRAITDKDFPWFPRPEGFRVHYLCLTQYDEKIMAPVAFPPQELSNTLGQVISRAGFKQLRIAETEKYAHVTYFFSGGQEDTLPGEQRLLIPSPQVSTYDLQPEMSAEAVTEAVVERIASGEYALVVLNYANPDMVGHTGNFAATVLAVETVDRCLGKVWAAVEKAGAALLVFSDHGNADRMQDDAGNPHTAHTDRPVPFILAWPGVKEVRDGALSDVAPTVLDLLDLAKPKEMTGQSLIIKE